MIDESEQREGWRAEIFQRKVKEEQPDGRPRPVIPWQRIKEFKLVTLKMIVSLMIQHQSYSPKKIKTSGILEDDPYAEEEATQGPPPSLASLASAKKKRGSSIGEAKLPELGSDLKVPGEVTGQNLVFLIPTTIIVSSCNPGAHG